MSVPYLDITQHKCPISFGGGAMCALPPKADTCGATTDVCFGPEADISSRTRPLRFRLFGRTASCSFFLQRSNLPVQARAVGNRSVYLFRNAGNLNCSSRLAVVATQIGDGFRPLQRRKLLLRRRAVGNRSVYLFRNAGNLNCSSRLAVGATQIGDGFG